MMRSWGFFVIVAVLLSCCEAQIYPRASSNSSTASKTDEKSSTSSSLPSTGSIDLSSSSSKGSSVSLSASSSSSSSQTTSAPGSSSSGSTTSSRSVSVNSTASIPVPRITAAGCCFVQQGTVSEAWWESTTYTTSVRNQTVHDTTYSVTLYETYNVTQTIVRNYTTKTTITSAIDFGGVNPITQFINGAQGPRETETILRNATAVSTGGVVVQSPQAFYIYNVVTIVVVPSLTVRGNAVCATNSAFTAVNGDVHIFSGINSNAEAAYGKSEVPIRTDTITETRTDTFTEVGTSLTARTTEVFPVTDYQQIRATIITLSAPFIYQPARGANVQSSARPYVQGPGKENYGYVPQAVIDHLAQNPIYNAQFPGIANCLPGGPSIVSTLYTLTSIASFQSSASQPPATGPPQTNADQLTSSTTVYVTAPGHSAPPLIPPNPEPEDHIQSVPQNPPVVPPNPVVTPAPVVEVPPTPPESPFTVPVILGSNPVVPNPAEPTPNPLGGIIFSIFNGNGDPTLSPQTFTPGANPVNTPVVINPTTIPVVDAPPGLVGSTVIIDNTPVIIVNNPTTIPAPGSPAQPPLVIPGATTIPVAVAPAGLVGSTVLVDGTPVIIVNGPTTIPAQPAGTPLQQPLVIPAATTIPLNQAPPGLQGSTVLIDGTTFVVVPGPTTLPANPIAPIVVPGATTIPVNQAPPGLQGSTVIINGTPFLVVPGPTTIPAALPQAFPTTNIGGTPFLVIPGPTSIPLVNAPPGLTGITTIINGTPFLVVPGATTVAAPRPTVQGLTVIGGTTQLILTGGLTTIPVNPSFSVSGRTTVINGITQVVVSGISTTIPLTSVATLSSSRSSISSSSLSSSISTSSSLISSSTSSSVISTKSATTLTSSKKTSSSKAAAAPTGVPGVWPQALGAIAGGVVLIVL